jgi:hypothetical protein
MSERLGRGPSRARIRAQILVSPAGFEPATGGLEVSRRAVRRGPVSGDPCVNGDSPLPFRPAASAGVQRLGCQIGLSESAAGTGAQHFLGEQCLQHEAGARDQQPEGLPLDPADRHALIPSSEIRDLSLKPLR